jgi:hypothetical protein
MRKVYWTVTFRDGNVTYSVNQPLHYRYHYSKPDYTADITGYDEYTTDKTALENHSHYSSADGYLIILTVTTVGPTSGQTRCLKLWNLYPNTASHPKKKLAILANSLTHKNNSVGNIGLQINTVQEKSRLYQLSQLPHCCATQWLSLSLNPSTMAVKEHDM